MRYNCWYILHIRNSHLFVYDTNTRNICTWYHTGAASLRHWRAKQIVSLESGDMQNHLSYVPSVVWGEQMAPHWGGGGKMAAVPLPAAILDDPISVSRGVTSWGVTPRETEMGSSKMAAGSGTAAILPPPPQWGAICSPHVLDDVSRTSSQESERPTNVCLPWDITSWSQRIQIFSETFRNTLWWCLIILLAFRKHLIVSLTQPFLKWLRELPACHYAEVDQSAHVNTTSHGK